MAKNICENSGSILGLRVETWCGDNAHSSKRIRCTLSSIKTYHCVKVHNLKTYDMNIRVKGKINSNFRKAKFNSLLPKNSEKEWKDSYNGLGQRGSKVFDHVSIERDGMRLSGTEKIHTEVHPHWPELQEPEDGDCVSIAFDVKLL